MGVAPQHGSKLLPGDGVVGAKQAVSVASDHVLAGGTANGLGIPLVLGHIGIVHGVIHHRTTHMHQKRVAIIARLVMMSGAKAVVLVPTMKPWISFALAVRFA